MPPRHCSRLPFPAVMAASVGRWSHAGPRKAKGAMSAPVLTPLTSPNCGRVPLRVSPSRAPACPGLAKSARVSGLGEGILEGDSFFFLLAVTATFFVAGFVKGVLGLGLPTLAMGLLGAVMAPAQAASLLVMPSLATNFWP